MTESKIKDTAEKLNKKLWKWNMKGYGDIFFFFYVPLKWNSVQPVIVHMHVPSMYGVRACMWGPSTCLCIKDVNLKQPALFGRLVSRTGEGKNIVWMLFICSMKEIWKNKIKNCQNHFSPNPIPAHYPCLIVYVIITNDPYDTFTTKIYLLYQQCVQDRLCTLSYRSWVLVQNPWGSQ